MNKVTQGGPAKRKRAAVKRIEFLAMYEKKQRLIRRDKKTADFLEKLEYDVKQLLDELIISID